MTAPGSINVGFVGWNPFQFLHYRPVIAAVPGATLIVEERRSARDAVDPATLGLDAVQVLRLPRRRMAEIDGAFDVLVCQTPFAGLENIRNSRIAMFQYGYAKEAHNFGPWRSLADLCLTFGEYASRKIEPFCPCIATGNPRYEGWDTPDFRRKVSALYGSRLDPSRTTILYAPTWGGLSSHGQFADRVLALSETCNVIIKSHHNTRDETASLAKRANVMVCGVMDDIVGLLSVSDVLISDFSGAIFDAIHCHVPIVLLDPEDTEDPAASRSDVFSIERARRSEIGEVVAPGDDIAAAVRRALENARERTASLADLRRDLFADAEGSAARVNAALQELATGNIQPGQSQAYIKQEMRAYFRCRNQFPILRRLQSLWTRARRADG